MVHRWQFCGEDLDLNLVLVLVLVLYPTKAVKVQLQPADRVEQSSVAAYSNL